MDYLEFFEDEKLSKKVFNTTGVCNKEKHYMVNINKKLKEIVKLVQYEKYFVINRPRQYGKTTTLNELEKILKSRYKILKLDFQGIRFVFNSEKEFCGYFGKELAKSMKLRSEEINNFIELASFIEKVSSNKEIVLIIDEVDKASNNDIFIDFLGMLRALYLSREVGDKSTFKSVVLAGVHDIKNLKLKFRDEGERRYNSPWNIATNFNVDMSFNEEEIATMLNEYANENELNLDIKLLSKEIYKFTSGYPFLVSRICQIVDEDITPNEKRIWYIEDIHKAIKSLLDENNTLFDDLIKNLENNKELFEYIYSILILGVPKIFNINNPVISIGYMFGYLERSENGTVRVSNQILKEFIYNYMISRADNNYMSSYNFKSNFITDDNGLDMKKIFLKFQQFMKENYRSKDKEFLERHGVLLFLSFIKPIINGVGFDYKEVQISEERRLDIVISYNNHKYIIETKIWHGEKAHENGLKQLENYLEIEGLSKGYLLIFNFNKNKEFTSDEYELGDKCIFETRV